MATFDQFEILEEVVVAIRNANVFTIAQRGVTTTSGTAALTGGTVVTISVPNVKNVRSVLIDATPLTYGSEYNVNYNSGTDCVVTLTSAQTGTATVNYDYGSDKIYAGYPRQDININSFPQIAVEFIDMTSDDGGFGNVNLNQYDLSIVVYDFKKSEVRSYIKALRSLIITNMTGFYGLRLVKPRMIGPIVPAEFEKFKDRVFKQNLDFNSRLNLEVN
jgi:hypothetical protein